MELSVANVCKYPRESRYQARFKFSGPLLRSVNVHDPASFS